MTECSVKKCEKSASQRGLCWMHYGRLYRTGTTDRTQPIPAKERFWDLVDSKNGLSACWLWTKKKDQKGYGRIKVDGKSTRAHRFSWIITNGPINNGLLVCHTCDNPPCCNPSHLYLGTVAQNNADKMARGRHNGPKGRDHPKAKFTEKQILQIRKLRSDGWNTRELAEKFNTRDNNISRICLRQVWKHI